MTSPAPTTTLSEHASKELLRAEGIPFARELLVADPDAAAAAAREIGLPVVVKLCGDAIAHKTERDLVRLGLADEEQVREAARDLLGRATPLDGEVGLLVAEMVSGRRELIAGLVRDPQFGPCVMLGLGGILTEALGDAVFAAAPLDRAEARRLIGRLRAHHLLTRPFRGEPAVDADALADVLVALSKLGASRPDIRSIDLNPLIVRGDRPVAVDALVELGEPAPDSAPARDPSDAEVLERFRPLFHPRGVVVAGVSSHPGKFGFVTLHNLLRFGYRGEIFPIKPDGTEVLERFRPLFHPRGVVVAGVSSHPGKFGFVTLHNLLRFGYRGEIFPIKPDGTEVLGRETLTSIDAVPEGAADLVFVCTPNRVNEGLLRDCAKKGVRAAFVASAGYAEAGDEGRALQQSLVETADQLGMLVVGPNGQGVISTPERMCAQIVAPFPPPGRIGIASQSGNLVSSFMNYAVLSGVGVSKAVSLGNSAQIGMAELLEYFAVDPDTDVAVVYVEGVGDGARFRRAVERLTRVKPLVLVKGGVGEAGKRAAASHTGALASDDRVFDGIARQLGVLRASSVEEAFEWAATLATQPVPTGRRTVVFTTAGGWGVLAADACSAAGLELIPLPEDIKAKIDTMVPARWSRSNPIDLAGGETRDTVTEVLELVCGHPDVDAVVHLGIGIQAAQANVFKSGDFYPEHGLERIAAYHERQDERFAAAAAEASARHGTPVLSATELAVCDREYGNAGPLGVRKAGRVCYPSAHRAVRALRALCDWGEFRAGSGAR